MQSVILEGDALEIIAALGGNDDGAGKCNFIVEARRLLMGFMS
jgi:hypothetical protein